ncbi:hypothetical protein M433DRAFT_10468 [Acidomyces richmondensis BFW]|nr:hypothetical protein M433DRAFT_10468 [Acidomyces richmondensis BFW]
MSTPVRDSYAFCESTVQDAISAYNSKQYKSIRATAGAFNLPESTLRKRMSGRISRSRAHEYRQSLSPAEEKTLLWKWLRKSAIIVSKS